MRTMAHHSITPGFEDEKEDEDEEDGQSLHPSPHGVGTVGLDLFHGFAVVVVAVFVGGFFGIAGVHHKSGGVCAGDDVGSTVDLLGVLGITKALGGRPNDHKGGSI